MAVLDSGRAGMVMDLLGRLAIEQQAAILVVTHDETIFGRFDDTVTLRDGQVARTMERPPSSLSGELGG